MSVTEGRNPGSSGYGSGQMKRWLDPAVVMVLTTTSSQGVDPNTVATERLILSGLSASLICHIGVGLTAGTVQGTQTKIEQLVYPAVPGTMQLTPIIHRPNEPRIYLRPVFQDPAGVANANTPLGQNLPFGWDFQTECDEVAIDISVPMANYDTALFIGIDTVILCQVTVEYNGQWPDIEAVKKALSLPRLTQVSNPKRINVGD